MSTTDNGCDMCRLYDRLAEQSREIEYWKRQALRWAEVVERQGLSYAERVQLEDVESGRDKFAERLPA